MKEGHINLYSDTQSRPTPAMREAILNAPVGDEQKGLDPTVNELCETVARLLGMEAAVFLPSGTMCNEIAILVHCRPGDEIYADQSAHIISFEAGGPAALAGASILPIQGVNGIFQPEQLSRVIRSESRYGPRPKMLSLEQTSNLGGGRVWPLETVQGVVEVAKSRELACHMDGARLMNAVVASDVSAKAYCENFDSAWIDLSKGLGCPFGAVLAGSQQFIDEAWRWKQRLGGALRQGGMMAAAGIYALEHHLTALQQDHQNAKRFAEIITAHPQIDIDLSGIETNILLVDIKETGLQAAEVVAAMEEKGINIGSFGPTLIRVVTHLNISPEQIEEAGACFTAVLNGLSQDA